MSASMCSRAVRATAELRLKTRATSRLDGKERIRLRQPCASSQQNLQAVKHPSWDMLESDAWRTAPINTRRVIERLMLEHMATLVR